MADASRKDLRGLVDMGSNGIRFSITDLAPATARSLPVVFQERLGVSLYDAQWSTGTKGPIPQHVIDDVVKGLKRFKAVCADFEVPETNIKVLATEATRTAENSEDYRKQIKDATGWEVEMLPKEVEGKVGALGIASSFDTVDGLVMDLGGGSTQLTWMIYKDGVVTTSPKGSVSFPFGAAAMMQRLSQIEAEKHSKKGRDEFKEEIKQKYRDAYESLEVPDSLKHKAKTGTLTLYLSGGGFRGWGYILMSRTKKGPYPIPIINGYHVAVSDFSNVDVVKTQAIDSDDIFRVSKRRASQVPAVAFLVDAIVEALPFIADVRFCQGGVREGYLFNSLPDEVRAVAPLPSATSRFAVDATSSAHIADLLSASLPTNGKDHEREIPKSLSPSLLRAIADTMYVQSNAPKESASLSALYLPVTGVLAAAHGVSHSDRALLGLTLAQRWDGDIPPPHDDFQKRLQDLLTKQECWWANYLGVVAALIGVVYPSGRVPNTKRFSLSSKWADGLGKKGNQQGIVLEVHVHKGDIVSKHVVKDQVEDIEDMGKKKNRIGGKEYGFGLPVQVEIEWI